MLILASASPRRRELLTQAGLEFVVEPRLFDRKHLSSLLVVIMVLILVEQYGLVGFFIAPPLAAAIQIIARELVQPAPAAALEIAPPPTLQIDSLKKRLFSIKLIIAMRAEPPAPEILSLVGRLDELIEKADQEEKLPE